MGLSLSWLLVGSKVKTKLTKTSADHPFWFESLVDKNTSLGVMVNKIVKNPFLEPLSCSDANMAPFYRDFMTVLTQNEWTFLCGFYSSNVSLALCARFLDQDV